MPSPQPPEAVWDAEAACRPHADDGRLPGQKASDFPPSSASRSHAPGALGTAPVCLTGVRASVPLGVEVATVAPRRHTPSHALALLWDGRGRDAQVTMSAAGRSSCSSEQEAAGTSGVTAFSLGSLLRKPELLRGRRGTPSTPSPQPPSGSWLPWGHQGPQDLAICSAFILNGATVTQGKVGSPCRRSQGSFLNGDCSKGQAGRGRGELLC